MLVRCRPCLRRQVTGKALGAHPLLSRLRVSPVHARCERSAAQAVPGSGLTHSSSLVLSVSPPGRSPPLSLRGTFLLHVESELLGAFEIILRVFPSQLWTDEGHGQTAFREFSVTFNPSGNPPESSPSFLALKPRRPLEAKEESGLPRHTHTHTTWCCSLVSSLSHKSLGGVCRFLGILKY